MAVKVAKPYIVGVVSFVDLWWSDSEVRRKWLKLEGGEVAGMTLYTLKMQLERVPQSPVIWMSGQSIERAVQLLEDRLALTKIIDLVRRGWLRG